MKQIFRLLISFFLVVSSIYSQSIEWKHEQIQISNKLSYLEDTKNEYTIDQISSKKFESKFIKSTKPILNFGFSESTFWLKFTINNSTKDNLVLEIPHAFLPITNLFYKDSTGKFIKLEAGYNVPLDKKIHKHHFQAFPILNGKHTYYIQVITNSHPLNIRILEAGNYEYRSYKQLLVYGFYIGFIVFVLLTNLFFFLSLRNNMYLYYAVVLVVYIFYSTHVMDGYILYLFPKVDMMFWYVLVPPVGMCIQLSYCFLFLEVKKYLPSFNKYAIGIVVYYASYIVIRFAFPLTISLAINTLNALMVYFIIGIVGYKVGKKGNKLGYYFTLAYILYFLMVLLEAMYLQTGFPNYLFGLSHATAACLIEAFILSFLLSKRFEWEKSEIENEKEKAQILLLEQTLENEKIIINQNLILEEKVAERTTELEQERHNSEQKAKDLAIALENLKKSQDQLIQSEKMIALGQLIAGVAHEINTPLGAIRSSVGTITKVLENTLYTLPDFLTRLSPQDSELFFKLVNNSFKQTTTYSSKEERVFKRNLIQYLENENIENAESIADTLVDIGIYENVSEYISLFKNNSGENILDVAYKLSGLIRSSNTITIATERASKIVFALKSFAHYNNTDSQVLSSVALGIETVLTLYENQLKNGVILSKNFDEIPLLMCYPDELIQVWTNLIHNALQAMENNGTLSVLVKCSENKIIVSIGDTGKGIPEEIKDKIFLPFFTTKALGEGSGLGLDIVKRIVEKHKGEIYFKSEPGSTVFVVELPV